MTTFSTNSDHGGVETSAVRRLLRAAQESDIVGNQLRGLGMQNFQCIRQPVFFPIEPLTLLYGPNSAGKSSIGDAIRFLYEFGHSTVSNTGVAQLLARWSNWSRLSDPPPHARFVGAASSVRLWAVLNRGESIRLGDSQYGIDQAILSDCFLPFEMLAGESALAISVAFDMLPDGAVEPNTRAQFCCDDFALWVGVAADAPLIWLSRRGIPGTDRTWMDLLVNTEHPELDRLLDGWSNTSAATLCGKSLEELCARIEGKWRIFDAYEWPQYLLQSADMVVSESHQWRDGFAEQLAAAAYLRGFVLIAAGAVSEACRLRCVPPVRSVPSARDSTVMVLARPSTLDLDRLAAVSMPDGDDPWFRLAQDAAGLAPANRAGGDERPPLLDYVNRIVGDESMLGLEYRLVADVYPVRANSGIKSTTGSTTDTASNDVARIVHLYLRTEAGHRVEFEDVGTGVSQLIPVLVALYYGDCVVHQPELHLHPALQSVLGDVLSERPQHALAIVESHSEHLLIRILRRVREAADSNHPHRFEIAHDKVCVLYFRKSEDGESQVFHLRINALGEFIDRWPDGFFSERDEDLGLRSV